MTVAARVEQSVRRIERRHLRLLRRGRHERVGLLLRGHAPLLAGRRVRRGAVDDGVLGGLPLAAAAARRSSGHGSRRRRGLRGGFRRLEPLDELLRERRVFFDDDPRVGPRPVDARQVTSLCCLSQR